MPTTNATTTGTTHIGATSANGEEKSKVEIGAPHVWKLYDVNNNVIATKDAANRIALFFTVEQTFVANRLLAVQKRNVMPNAELMLAKAANDKLLAFEQLADEAAEAAGAHFDKQAAEGGKLFHLAGEKKGQEKTRAEYIAEKTQNDADYWNSIDLIDKNLKKLYRK